VQIHARMLESLLRAKMMFFSKTLVGSIIQRFGKDLVSDITFLALNG
jgi:ABC-type bacteriocin/lantibiotic exporter with double-glycine peptidase domain